MKKNWILFLFFAAATILTFSSCSDDDNNDAPENTHLVSKEVQDAFHAKYPQAKDIEWELKGNCAIVDFDWDGKEHSAWFNPSSSAWYMTETDIRYENLPESVLAAYKAGEYADWRVDDVDMLTREGMETLYIIEVEKGEAEVDLFYSPTGILVKTVVDTGQENDYDGFLPQTDVKDITDFISQKYPNASIIEIDRENGMFEVEILDGRVCRDVYFNNKNEWIKTTWDVYYIDLPDAVKEAVKTKYQGYKIDDVNYVQTSSGDWYELDLENEKTDHEIENIKITVDGGWIE